MDYTTNIHSGEASLTSDLGRNSTSETVQRATEGARAGSLAAGARHSRPPAAPGRRSPRRRPPAAAPRPRRLPPPPPHAEPPWRVGVLCRPPLSTRATLDLDLDAAAERGECRGQRGAEGPRPGPMERGRSGGRRRVQLRGEAASGERRVLRRAERRKG